MSKLNYKVVLKCSYIYLVSTLALTIPYQAQLLVVVEDGVQVLDPDRIDWPIENDPLTVAIGRSDRCGWY